MEYQLPKGVFDILPASVGGDDAWRTSDRFQYVESVMRKTAHDYGFYEIRTPIFEKTELFIRGVGASSDIVSKEMYVFEDKGKRSMTLRPEGTAPVMRSIIEKNLDKYADFKKLFYIGPYFRYDRPQAGRYRQFHQFGVEAICDPSPFQDLEVIDMICELYNRLGIKNINVMLNSVGNEACRIPYKKALIEFLKPHFHDLSKESQIRLEQNPLRILDTKNEKEQELLKSAPSILKYLDEECEEHFHALCTLLKKQNIPFIINQNLVRGLDYYNKTVFEITSDVLGAQNTIGAGGRYDGLTEQLGGTHLPAFGYGTGIERILLTMAGQECYFPKKAHPFAFFIALGEDSKKVALDLMYQARHQAIPSEISNKKIQKALQIANSMKAEFAIIIGDEELETNNLQIKNLNTRETISCKREEFIETLSKYWKELNANK